MSTNEWSDNLSFLSALGVLEGLVAQGLLTDIEGQRAREELKRRLRPTLILA